MSYLLLTGATGFVGRYLLHYFLEAGQRVAVLVRPGKLDSASRRVDAVMRHWEREVGHALPRPVVLAADLTQPLLALDDVQQRWIRDHCHAMLHCAASMTFREDRHGEPFRTNVQGTENVLELCRQTGIRRFHQVSTAYICGLREGRILESEVDLGQQLGNVYEQSKLRAETLIRQAEFLDERTFYRPASVVGDSQTGYVTNFHGFYLPLRLAHMIAAQVPVSEMNERFVSILGLRGDEGKNLVPVDWLARAIVHLYLHPEFHGQTYHLASDEPVEVRQIQRVIQEAIERYHPNPIRKGAAKVDLEPYEALFQDYMSIYRSHWRDDPKFDLTNTRRALPHLPIPKMNYETLLRITRYPVEQNFTVLQHEEFQPDCDLERHLGRLIEAGRHAAPASGRRVGLQVNGSGGGQWQLMLADGRLAAAAEGLPPGETASLYLTAATFRSLVERQLTVERSIATGRVLLEGSNGDRGELLPVLEQVVGAGS